MLMLFSKRDDINNRIAEVIGDNETTVDQNAFIDSVKSALAEMGGDSFGNTLTSAPQPL